MELPADLPPPAEADFSGASLSLPQPTKHSPDSEIANIQDPKLPKFLPRISQSYRIWLNTGIRQKRKRLPCSEP